MPLCVPCLVSTPICHPEGWYEGMDGQSILESITQCHGGVRYPAVPRCSALTEFPSPSFPGWIFSSHGWTWCRKPFMM